MKPLLALICAVAIGYVAYQYVYPPFGAYFGIDHPPVKEVPQEEPKKELALEMPKVEMTKPAPKPEPPPEPKPEPKPMVVEAPPPPPEPPKPKEGEFVPPTFKPLEEITQNWTVIPKSIFASPREVKIGKEVEVKSAIGATKIPAGSKAYAMGQEGANLVVSPSPESKFRGQLAIADTNLQEVITNIYENYKVTQTARAKKLFELKKEEALHPKVAASGKGGTAADDKPAKDKDGTYPLLMASMKSGEVTEIKPENIKKWGEVTREKVEGQEVWSVTVTFEAATPFGKFEQDAQAQVKNGKVLKWIYTGSGEVVP